MTRGSDARRTTTGGGRRRGAVGGILFRLLLALALAVWVMAPFLHWDLRLDRVEYIVPWLLRPENGFLSLAALFWIWLQGPGMLRAIAAPPRREQEPLVVEEPQEGRLGVPSVGLEALGLEHRVEMARALGVPWRDELLVDQEEWTRVCRAAARDRAVMARP